MNNSEYWNDYYAKRRGGRIPIPSQFAAFVAGELGATAPTVVDLGCGNGRDALFFARHGHRVVGVDASSEAVKACTEDAHGLEAQFLCSDITAPNLAETVRAATGAGPLLIYARFFLHAIDEEGEAGLLRLAAALCEPGCRMALEFRTMRDRELAKATAAHYRRFIDPLAFLTHAIAHGFELSYFVEGFGYAKYQADDAHVARVILQKS